MWLLLIGVLCLAIAVLSAWKPRAFAYVLLFSVPFQWIPYEFESFSVSVPDLIVLSGAVGALLRTLVVRGSGISLRAHGFVFLMLLVYFLGFLIWDYYPVRVIRLCLPIVCSLLICESLTSRQSLEHAATALIFGAGSTVVYGCYLYFIDDLPNAPRFSSFGNPNYSALYLLPGALLCFARSQERKPILYGVLGVVFLVFGFATQSQGGILAFIVAMGFFLWPVIRKSHFRILVSILGGAIVALAFQDWIWELVLDRNTPVTHADAIARSTVDVRILVHRVALEIFLKHPFFGVGYGRAQLFSSLDPEIAVITNNEGYATHNTYLEVLLEGGVLAFILFMAQLAVLWPAVKTLMSGRKSGQGALQASMIGIPFILVSALAINILNFYVFWGLVGLTLAGLRVMNLESLRDTRERLQVPEVRPELEAPPVGANQVQANPRVLPGNLPTP